MNTMIGIRIREARQSRRLSLTDLATRAKISAATLSRIERDKQNLDLSLFLTLTHLLNVAPHELLEEEDDDPGGLDPLARKIASLSVSDRVKLWRELAAARKQHRSSIHQSEVRALALHVEELLAQIDFLRGEIEAVQKRLRRK